MNEPFKGEMSCQGFYKTGVNKGKPCVKVAYYAQGQGYFCGTHSKADLRKELKVNPQKAVEKAASIETQDESIIASFAENIANKKPGDVICSKMGMRQAVVPVAGYQSVFPNFHPGNRKDGEGCPSLSPMSLGPVEHNIPDLKPANHLEGYWQGSKLFGEECRENREATGGLSDEEIDWRTATPTKDFHKNRKMMFFSDPPLRRKPDMTTKTVCFIWVDKQGREVHLDYITSRQIYCNLYERLAEQEDVLRQLRDIRLQGMNLNIVGYDGFDFRVKKGETIAEKLMACYLDPKQPFGHELCLVSLLVLKPEEYPWRIHKTLDI